MRAVPALLLAVLAASAAASDIQPGEWEIAIETTAPVAQQQTLRQCLTEADARDPSRILMGSGPTSQPGCGLADKRDSGSHMDFSVRCTGSLPIAGQGWVDYSATSLQGEIQLQMQSQGAAPAMGIASRMSARRVGACSKG